jgi:hypothetical protein
MNHVMCRIQDFQIIGPYTLRVVFDDAAERIINFEPVPRGELYGPLRDPGLFNRVAVDPEVRTLVWPNGADFDPATLHEWPNCGAAFAEMASRW